MKYPSHPFPIDYLYLLLIYYQLIIIIFNESLIYYLLGLITLLQNILLIDCSFTRNNLIFYQLNFYSEIFKS